MSDPEQNRVRVLVADDHPVVRDGVAAAIGARTDMELVGATSDGPKALEAIRRLRPDVAVLDMKMRDLDGVELLGVLEADELPTRVVFLSAFLEPAVVHAAIRAGARGYLSKQFEADVICDAVAAVAQGRTVLCAEAQKAIGSHLRDEPAGPSLTPREREVLVLAAAGHPTSEIAERLHMSPTTVKTHLHRTYQKLGVGDRTAAVAEAMRRGLLE
jgi:two-component system nitrate/nitrite response regulator NarL